MSHKRTKLTQWDILDTIKLPLLPGDIVTSNIYFPQSNAAKHCKILDIYKIEIPYKNAAASSKVEIWADVEIVHSPKTPAAVGIKMSNPVAGYRRIKERTVTDFINELIEYHRGG